ncbi:MAG: peptidase U32 family protein [bacterium]
MPVIVAPCGRSDAAETLLAAGADGLYVGLDSLSHGRRGAELSLKCIEAACRTARTWDAFVLLSLNLMPLVAEEPLWRSVVAETVELGVDGVILQDPGLAVDLRRIHPRLAIHASVGAAALNAADARFWREAGADVLVLQPGTTPEEAASIRRDGGIEVELFVSGRTCQATLLGQCGMGNYLKQAWKSSGWRDAIPEGSRKRSGVCYYVCEGAWEEDGDPIGKWGPVPIELGAPLADYLAAGVTHLKLGGRGRPVAELAGEIRAVRQVVDEEEWSNSYALSGNTRS